jgi:hypothetical protein
MWAEFQVTLSTEILKVAQDKDTSDRLEQL